MPREGKVDLNGLFPGLDPSKRDEVRENLERFLGIVFRISERQAKDMPADPVAEPRKGQLKGTGPNTKTKLAVMRLLWITPLTSLNAGLPPFSRRTAPLTSSIRQRFTGAIRSIDI